jgi:hypothetical protein
LFLVMLVMLGTVVAAFAGRLRVPAPSSLVIAGAGRRPAAEVPAGSCTT